MDTTPLTFYEICGSDNPEDKINLIAAFIKYRPGFLDTCKDMLKKLTAGSHEYNLISAGINQSTQ